MIALELHPRIIENKDWATLVFVLTLALIVLAKTAFESRFNDFIRLIVSDKYNKIYRESSHLMSGFNVLFFVVNIVSISFFIHLILTVFYNYGDKTDWILFVRIFTLMSVFILSKFLIEKIIAVTFGIEEIIEQFNLQKVNFRTYIGLLLLPVSIIMFYSNYVTETMIIVVIVALFIINLLTYLLSLKNYQNLIFSQLFYFILYLCALEIAPYYFIYYLITKN
ncbi:DUF4271 domain-containing protein [Flavobacterium sp. SUN052]|uniref:DUF4271 domain-containing protein n=1 Tax=Flavobacterium sp. SUN052 TaxID=3002441 RepID=UPI00237E039E|nr:DUF4271 domain-containing protein [Flavobacterium sp. SUN052]MEC4004059.1 DUF4271 domain-containing protein [Flavobacterium sp. SUN052]